MKKIPFKTNQDNPEVKAYKAALERGMKNHHVIHQSSGWAVKRAGDTKASGIYITQKEAINEAVSIAQNQGTSVFIHGADGRIRESRSY